MADRRNYYFDQPVTDAELDEGFALLEVADRNFAIDNALVGVASGMAVAEHAAPDLTVNVTAGTAYDQAGQRIRIPSTQTVDVSKDSSDVTTTVSTGGNSKVVSLYVKFKRDLSDPRTDGNSNTVYFVANESFEFFVKQGAEATTGSETPASLESDKILLADIKRTQGVTTILNAVINPYATNRRQDVFVVDGTPNSLRVGTIKAVAQQVFSIVNTLAGDVPTDIAAALAAAEAYADDILSDAENYANAQIAALAVPQTALAAASGVATLNASTKLTAAQRVGWIVETQKITRAWSNSPDTYSAGAFTDITSPGTLTFAATAVAGDQVIVHASVESMHAAQGQVQEYEVVIGDGGDQAQTADIVSIPGTNGRTVVHITCLYTVVTGGAVTARIKGHTVSGTPTTFNVYQASILGQLVRP